MTQLHVLHGADFWQTPSGISLPVAATTLRRTWGPGDLIKTVSRCLSFCSALAWADPRKLKVQLEKGSPGLAHLGQGSNLPLDLRQVLLIDSELQLQLLDVVFQFALA